MMPALHSFVRYCKTKKWVNAIKLQQQWQLQNASHTERERQRLKRRDSRYEYMKLIPIRTNFKRKKWEREKNERIQAHTANAHTFYMMFVIREKHMGNRTHRSSSLNKYYSILIDSINIRCSAQVKREKICWKQQKSENKLEREWEREWMNERAGTRRKWK